MKTKFEVIITAVEDNGDLVAKILAHHTVKGQTLLEVAAKIPIVIAEVAQDLSELDKAELEEELNERYDTNRVDNDIPF